MTNNSPCIVLRRKEDTDGIGRNKTILGGEDIDVKIIGSLEGNSRASSPQRMRSFRKSLGSSSPRSQPQVTNPDTSSTSTVTQKSCHFVSIKFQDIKRMDIRAGDIVLVKNREMIPADMILLGSSGENGAAYIETSPIDGETNLKLRNSPQLPVTILPMSTPHMSQISEENDYVHPKHESIETAVKRITRISLLGHPDGVSSLLNPKNSELTLASSIPPPQRSKSSKNLRQSANENQLVSSDDGYVATLTTELPNASVNTFSGKITLPPTRMTEPSIDIPLDAENILLRGAMLRNTEWVLGVACFTGADTKLARNSIQTPSKFSRLDELMNRTVILILLIMIFFVLMLSLLAYQTHIANFDHMWYLGFAKENTPWPYFKIYGDDGQEIYPKFRRDPPRFFQFVFTFITLLNNFVPLSLYVTVEMVTRFMMYMLGWDREMYHEETDTPAVARSTTITDLGQVKYVFSDKTGTLTQNVMCFKRCSVDGSIFGAPVLKAGPDGDDNDMDNESMRAAYHSLKQLLVGSISLTRVTEEEKEEEEANIMAAASTSDNLLTFNAEMFLRVMSICHTVVVEKEIDATNLNNKSVEEKNERTGMFKGLGRRSRNNTADNFEAQKSPLGAIIEASSSVISAENDSVRTPGLDASAGNFSFSDRPLSGRSALSNSENIAVSISSANPKAKSADGSPGGFAYQAESPDEGALVSAASLDFGFQLISRDSDGVKLSCESPSLLSISEISNRLKKGSVTPRELAAETACPQMSKTTTNPLRNALRKWCQDSENSIASGPSEETWTILAVNKFDSTRKRMSVLVRSPPELGSIPMLLIKGADSSMLDPEVCEGGEYIASGSLGDENMKGMIRPSPRSFEDSLHGTGEWEKSVLLNMQSQLGIFASEGLRTLVLGVRVLTEDECDDWLTKFNGAATAIENREAKLTAVAKEIETKIHIVGSTAIEDKLQDGVPETIESISKAGIKLWVLTGDKRETAIEIGYSTKVLNPNMHLTDVADGTPARVKAMVAMEFMRLVKIGKLPMYQRNAEVKKSKLQRFLWPIFAIFSAVGRILRFLSRTWRRFYFTFIITFCGLCRREYARIQLGKINDEVNKEMQKKKGRHQQIRNLAESILHDFKLTSEYASERKISRKKSIKNFPKGLGPDEEPIDALPEVFHRASNANTILDIQSGTLNSASIRGLSLMTMQSDENAAPNADSQPVIDEDVLSLASELPGQSKGSGQIFNKKKRNMLERMFAVDKDVRKGRLVRHLTKEKRIEVESSYSIMPQTSAPEVPDGINAEIDRAFVIEGSALAHFLGDPNLEELLFSVASSCESVIACRVSPKQKALLVKLVKQFVVPTPVTLAIGDGANDVGMIQEAQIGVGISGLEGQQAVNSSDFAIAQFRFLENLLLVHGRWNFMRLSKVVLFSFYKNAVLAGLLIVYSSDTLYSGEPVFDMWALSTFNFVNGFGILLLGMFDRDVDKDYVKRNPILYAAGPNNEHMALRVTFRWIALVLLHVNVIYYITDICLEGGSSQSSAFQGLMHNFDDPGDGDGGDLKIFGSLIFVILNWVLSLKVLYESGSIIHGKWPALMGCSKKSKEGFYSRVAYTWHGIIFLCIGFNYFFIYIYDVSIMYLLLSLL